MQKVIMNSSKYPLGRVVLKQVNINFSFYGKIVTRLELEYLAKENLALLPVACISFYYSY